MIRRAVAAGYPQAIGFMAAHWVPEWSAISDPIWQVDSLTWFSTLASTAEVVGALLVALAGLAAGKLDCTPQPAEGGPADLSFHGMVAYVQIGFGGDPAQRAPEQRSRR